MHKIETLDQINYINEYRKASLYSVVRIHMGTSIIKLDQTILEMESFQNSLSRLATHDCTLSKIIRTERSLYDPMQPFREYILKLEKSLRSSSLLHEHWGYRSISHDRYQWSGNVSIGRSIKCFAKLLVCLIDNTNPRAFFEDWSCLPGAVSTPNNQDAKDFVKITEHWRIESEIQTRKWERSTSSDVLSLLTKDSEGIWSIFHKGISRENKIETHRKKKKYPLDMMHSNLDDASHSATILDLLTNDNTLISLNLRLN